MHRSTGMGIVNAEQQNHVHPQSAASATVQQQPPALMDLQIVPPPQLEFKEMVSQKCAERGIIFAPMPGRRESGKQVWTKEKIIIFNIKRYLYNFLLHFFRFIVLENYFVILIVQLL